ncbi:MAG: AraC family transcriptional regulator [Clostridiales bacterium]|nr:AraC family transcriptional regulator [Clostridiales bacterium]
MDNLEIIKESVNYIESNLYRSFNPTELCNRYDISEFHYYQLFKHIIGVPLMEYILKRRLSDQLYRWASSNKKIPLIKVAHNANLASLRVVSKILKQEFRISSRQYHKTFDGTELYPAFNHHKYTSTCENVFDKNSEIITMPSATLIGLSTPTHLWKQQHHKDISHLKKKVDMHYDHLEGLDTFGNPEVGVSYNTSIDLKKNDNISFEYFRGYYVTEISKLPSDFRVLNLPRQLYLRFLTTTDSEVFDQTLKYIYSDYLIHNPVKLKNTNINLIERYRYDKTSNHHMTVELYIPVELK